jgi:hypothetical protein
MTSDTERVKRNLEKTEAGDTEAARKVEDTRQSNPEPVDAAEQELSEAPGGRGLSR